MRIKFVLVIMILAAILSGCAGTNPYAPSPTPTPLPAGQQRIVTALPAVDTAPNSDAETDMSETISSELLIGSDNGLEVYFLDAYIGDDDKEYYELMLHNTSGNTMRADSISVSINGVSVFAYMSEFIEPGDYYLYKDSLSTQQASFMTGYEKAVQVQAEIYGISPLDNSVIAHVNSTLVLDESIELNEPKFEGQILYDTNNFILGIDKIADEDTITDLVIYYQNNSDEALAIAITKMNVGPYSIPDNTFFTISQNSYAYWVIHLNASIPNETYESSIEYTIINDIMAEIEGPEHETVTFTLE